LQLINAYRFLGVRHANVDPLKRFEKPIVPELDPAFYGLTEADMNLVFNSGSLVGPDQMPLREILRAVKETYGGSIGIEYMYITDTQIKRWIQQRFESIRSQPSYDADFKRHVLERLTAAETLENTCTRAMSDRSVFPWKAAKASSRCSIWRCSARHQGHPGDGHRHGAPGAP